MTANEQAAKFNLLKEGAGFSGRQFNDREISSFLTQAETELVLHKMDELKNRTQRGFKNAIRQNELGSLLASHKTFKIEAHDFMMGTEDNGAYRTPDLDAQLNTVERYGVFVNVPDECLLAFDSYCTLTKAGMVTDLVPVTDVDGGTYNDYILDPFKNPSYDSVWRMNSGSFTPSSGSNNPSVKGLDGVSAYDKVTPVTLDTNRSHHLIPGNGYTISRYTLNYIKKPADIVVNVRNPQLQKNSELPTFLHDEVITRALRIAGIPAIPAEQQYQVMDKETREAE